MTKAEKAQMDELRHLLMLSRALRFPDYPVPQPMSHDEIRRNLKPGGNKYGHQQMVTRGWFYNAYLAPSGRRSNTVSYGCSDGVHHSWQGDVTSSQGAGRMYRTKLDALHALRHELTAACAEVLAEIDETIAVEGAP